MLDEVVGGVEVSFGAGLFIATTDTLDLDTTGGDTDRDTTDVVGVVADLASLYCAALHWPTSDSGT